MSITIHPRNNFETELNIASGNFRILKQLLLIEAADEDYEEAGSISAQELEEKIILARAELSRQSKEWERSYSDTIGDNGAKIIELPLYQHQIYRYLDKLGEIIQIAKQNNVQIDWA